MADVVDHQCTLYRSKNPTRRWLHQTRRRWIKKALRSHAPSRLRPSRGLEIGPGSGTYLPTLLELCDQVIATDIEPAFLTQAQAVAVDNHRLETRVDNLIDTRLPEASFDLILCTEVIEHLPDSTAALVNLAKLLKPNGTLILSTPQRWSLLESCARIALLPGVIRLTRAVYGESVEPTGHINLLTPAQLQAQISNAGLHWVSHWRTGLYFPVIAELGGWPARRMLGALERCFGRGILGWALWTQYYVIKRR